MQDIPGILKHVWAKLMKERRLQMDAKCSGFLSIF